ncbi:MAG: ribosome maturation factor RimP [Elusimicrobia bacterium]|nr:ribosome maturation factor RimP [Elusimicrobiota bacterium]
MGLVEDIEILAGPVLSEAGVELVQVEYHREPQGWILRFYLDKEGGFSLADCEEWTGRLGGLLDERNIIAHAYSLEVSSPGLNRPLRKPDDFKRFLGIDAVIKLYAAQNGQKNFHGKLVSLENDELVLMDRTTGLVRLPLSAIASAKLDPPVEL